MRFWKYLCILCVLLVGMCGCQKEKKAANHSFEIYYIEGDGQGLVSEEYSMPDDITDVAAQVHQLLEKLQTAGSKGKYQSPIEPEVEISDFQIKETQLSIYFTTIYNNRTGIDEILSRAAIVKTVCQVAGIDYVDFYVEDQPLMISGKAVGVMSATSFLDELNPEYTSQKKQVTLYFADSSGEKLQEVITEITYNSAKPLAQILMEQLIAGPETLEDLSTLDLKNTVPEGTVLNSITIRDNICYVDLNRDFMNMSSAVNSDVVVYSIVNTLCELSTVSRVQFTIDGEQQENYGDTKDFNTPYERNLDLLVSGDVSKG